MRTTNEEKLFIDRKRRGLSQTAMARRLGILGYVYRKMELGRMVVPRSLAPRTGSLARHEALTLMRRRKGMTQRVLAARIGCCRLWVIQMESGIVPITKLSNFWLQHGTSSPKT